MGENQMPILINRTGESPIKDVANLTVISNVSINQCYTVPKKGNLKIEVVSEPKCQANQKVSRRFNESLELHSRQHQSTPLRRRGLIQKCTVKNVISRIVIKRRRLSMIGRMLKTLP